MESVCTVISGLSSIIGEFKNEQDSFIFTLKNPHDVAPTRFVKRKDSKYSIYCNPTKGPSFGYWDIWIDDECDRNSCCGINNDGTNGYECDPTYKSLLYANQKYFAVLDYEVYCMTSRYEEYVFRTCMHPEIIWKYLQTREIPEESLDQLNKDDELLDDLKRIHCDDKDLKLKLRKKCITQASSYLPGSVIVDSSYDKYLMEWVGDVRLKLIYTASKQGFSSRSFHECCDDVGPTLVVIMSTDGWIFGGYTSKSWKVVNPSVYGCIYLLPLCKCFR